uniref:Sushi domain-containing protein n=1 Tax=Anopheles minimus TaxID=112268 RepID=A0A182WKT7_9DIPT
SATANNHQLSSSSSSSSEAASSTTVSTSSVAALDADVAGTPPAAGSRLRAEAAQLVDNKIHDKLQRHEPTGGRMGAAPATAGRQKREDIFSDNVLTNNYQLNGDARRWEGPGTGALQSRITEEVLLVSNLTEERAREETELLEHLNRDRFHGSQIKLDNSDDRSEARSGPQRAGKKGRRRKGHKKHKHKKIKLLPVTLVGVPVDDDGQPDTGIIEGLTNGADGAWSLKLSSNGRAADGFASSTGGDGQQTKSTEDIARTVDGGMVEMVDVWKETTMPPSTSFGSQSSAQDISEDRRPAMVSGFPPPPVLASDEHLVFGSVGAMQITLPADQPDAQRPKWIREQRKREKQQRKQLQKVGEQRKIVNPPLPPLPSGVTVSSASTVTFPADDHKGTETVSVARVIISGDLSCMKDDFIPAPAIANGDIKYLRNDLYGLEHSFLEAEYHCRMGYRLRMKDGQSRTVVTSTGAIANANLVCRKSRWIGKRPACVRIKPSERQPSPYSTVWPLDSTFSTDGQSNDTHATNVYACGKDHRCPQACHRVTTGRGSLNRTTVCSCYKGFKMVNHRCVGECSNPYR